MLTPIMCLLHETERTENWKRNSCNLYAWDGGNPLSNMVWVLLRVCSHHSFPLLDWTRNILTDCFQLGSRRFCWVVVQGIEPRFYYSPLRMPAWPRSTVEHVWHFLWCRRIIAAYSLIVFFWRQIYNFVIPFTIFPENSVWPVNYSF